MKKITLFLFSGLLLAGCSLPGQSKPAEPPADTPQAMVREFEKVATALQAGKGIECLFTHAESGTTMTYQMMGEKIKTTGQFNPENQESGGMISDGQFMYTWSDNTKSGTKLSLQAVEGINEEQAEPTPDLPEFETEADQARYESLGYTITCNEKNLTDADFVPPQDVTFQDLSTMMNQVKTMEEKSLKNPENQPPVMTEEDAKALMEQFGQE